MPALVAVTDGQNYVGTLVPTVSTSPLMAVTAGNLLLILVRGFGATSVTDLAGNTYTLRATDPVGTLRIFSCPNCLGIAGNTFTANFSPSVNYVSIVALQFSGAAGGLLAAFTTPAVTVGTTIDLAYHTGGFAATIIVGLADLYGNAGFSFAAVGTPGDPAPYLEPVADHTSAAFVYRLPAAALPADTLRATTPSSGVEKHLLLAVFTSTAAAVVLAGELDRRTLTTATGTLNATWTPTATGAWTAGLVALKKT